MSSAEASPAKTSAQPDDEQESSTGSDQGCGRQWPRSFAVFVPATCSWRIPHASLFELETGSSRPRSSLRTWPRSGMTCDGIAYPLPASAPLTSVIGGSVLPTPTASSYGSNQSASPGASVRPGLETMARRNLWPTPRVAADRTSRAAATRRDSRSAPSLAQAVELAAGMLPRELFDLDEAPESWRRLWPTPIARDSRTFKGGRRSPNAQGSEPLIVQAGGDLNPTWVEWLMGFPLGWTDLADGPESEPSVTP